ncbi:hypothetical protein [Microcella sp.]|uniref:hypothetical protein n=1 Tax=Microcella sp. TaxID=1913979 RepID=UPI00255F5F15|nr:hypothetical protein [Microcella sp.]MBX9471428.1 hypothetical protein [Microcella sp.]
MTRRNAWTSSPWDADPLSWFTSPNLPLAAAVLGGVHGALVLTVSGQAGSRPLVQVAALVVAVGALLGVHVATRPPRGALTLRRAIPLALLSSAALVLSAWGYRGEPFAVELWWAPLVSSLTLLAMAPYASSQRLSLVGAVVFVVGAVTVLALVVPDEQSWPPYTTTMIALFPIVIGTLGGVLLVQAITSGLARWSERPLELAPKTADDGTLIAEVDAVTTARIADATQLIRGVLERGSVSDGDARLAAQLSERLRDELTADVDRTWLERVAQGQPVRVDDEHRLADQLDLAQRTALRALLDALLAPDDARIGLARLELRRTDHGAIAVALRIASAMPEGRRETFLAPYYVGLKSTVDKLRWRSGPLTAVEFEVSGGAPASTPLRTPPAGSPGGPRR